MGRSEDTPVDQQPDRIIPQKISFEEKARIVKERILPMQIIPNDLQLYVEAANNLGHGFVVEQKAEEDEPFIAYDMVKTGTGRSDKPVYQRQLVNTKVGKGFVGVYLIVPNDSPYSRPYVSFFNKLLSMGYHGAFSKLEYEYPQKPR